MSKQCVIFSLLILSICYGITIAADLPCGDWEPYKEEKCFKIFDKVGLQTYEDAEKTCHQQDNSSRLISIRFREEQEFITNLFKTHRVVDNVWIGAKYIINKFKWSDDSELVFTNWAEGSPKNKSDHCVQLQSDETTFGKWSDVLCDKKNLVVCQKRQTWSLSRLQEILLDVKLNPVPIGFIYVQLPNEKSPTEIWPWMTWKDITSAYAGLFFRAEGGNSVTFGNIQEENSPRLSKVQNFNGYERTNSTDIQPGNWSPHIYSGGNSNGTLQSLAFFVSSGEVRPRNMAIRVWKRTR
jgi:hypothetical protein